MKALVKTKSGIGNVELREMPEPEVKANQVLIEVRAAGLCGTDLHIYYDEFKNNPPVTLGHEVSGVVARIGENVENIEVGTRVTTETYFQTCGVCAQCRNGRPNLCLDRLSIGSRVNGGMAKYVVVPSKNVHRLPDNVDFKEGALTEPLACVIHSTFDMTRINPGDIVVVSGPGPIGLLATQLAKQSGACTISIGASSDAARLKVAQELGVDYSLNLAHDDPVELVNDLSGGQGADVVMECAGVEGSIQMCMNLVRRAGQYTQIGLVGKFVSLEIDQVAYKEVPIRGSNATVPSAWKRALKLMEMERIMIEPLISHVLPISDWEKAFEIFEEKSGLKTVLTPVD